MQSVRIGDVLVSYDARGIDLRREGHLDAMLHFDRGGIRELMELLRDVLEAGLDERHGSRVPVLSSTGVSAHIMLDGQLIPVNVRNISLSGMLIDPPAGDLHELSIGQELTVTLDFEEVRLNRLRALVQRRAGTAFGLYFPDCVDGDELNPPPILARIVRELQQRQAARLKPRKASSRRA